MNEMIERVARAIAEAQMGPGYDWTCFVDEGRAAIAAMRAPTEAMIDEGADELRAGDLTRTTPPHVWRAMIDAALED